MKCENCGALIENQNSQCSKCLTAVQNNTTNPTSKTINKKLNILLRIPRKIIYLLIIINIIIIVILTKMLIENDKPRQVFKTSLDVLQSEINKSFSIDRTAYQMIYEIETHLNENDLNYGELHKRLNELTLKLDLFNNIEEHYLFYELVTTYKYQNHIDIIGLLDRNLLYVTSPYDFKEYYAFDTYNNIFSGLNRITDEEFLIIANNLISTFNSVLNSDYFHEKQSIVTLNGEQLNLITNTFILNENNIKEISKKVIKKLKRNVDFINACSKYKNIDGVDFIGNLNRLSESIEIGEYKIPDTELSIYMNTNQQIIGFGIKTNNKLYNVFIEENNIKVYEGFEEEIINIKKDETKYTIKYFGGEIIIKYQKRDDPIFSKPIVDDKNILFESLTEDEKKEISDKIKQNKVMQIFLKDFDEYIKTTKNSIKKVLNPSETKFKKDIIEIIEKAQNEKKYIQSLSGNSVFTNEITIPGNKLNVNKVKSIYYIKLDEQKNVTRIVYLNNKYCFDSDKINDLEYITKEDIDSKYFVMRTKKDSYEQCKSNIRPFN